MPLRPLAAALLLLPLSLAAQDAPQPRLPAIDKPLPPAADRTARANVMLADYRYGDLLWENDRTAHRVYGHALEAHEPPSGSGIDAWGKNVAWPFMDRQLKSGDQHGFHGEGIDHYNVGTGRGAGGLGIWLDNKLWTSRNFVRHRILRNGPDTADFEVDYAPWPVDVARKVWETRRFTLPTGTHFTRMVSTIASDKPGPLIVGVGIGRKPTGSEGEVTIDKAKGLISWWGPDVGDHGRMAIALRVDPAMLVDVVKDADNHLALLRVTPGKPFVYYSGAAWSLGNGGFRTRADWDRHVGAEKVTFTVPPRGPNH
ncbi:DUF4861 family protein [Sphingomonas sp. HF-S4]|uniref:DUF4861 family protein n=1 Tax=Sphingomonas agrestis TaxID=3080540 RepID=A0ABU3Y9K5_9SPHN|nr:DUF4861 family protein [Sphingomonas sp. HF-S4]MDV3457797.1 DUF4861 family protein [Sphingomonas sp. HF-S4]